MYKNILANFVFIASFFSSSVFGQSMVTRPPAIPLVTCDPYFSIWSFSNHPGDDYPRHWTGKTMGICSMVKIDGMNYRVVGKDDDDIPDFHLVSTTIHPTQTIFLFEDAGVELKLLFTTPLFPDSLDLISEDASYVTWQVKSIDHKPHHVSIYIDNSSELCLNTPDQNVTLGRLNLDGVDVMRMGSSDQPVLEKKGDDLRIDWGYVYMASPKAENPATVLAPADEAREAFIKTGILPTSDDFTLHRQGNDGWPVQACSFDLGNVNSEVAERFILFAYDDIYAIEYFYRKLPAYWKRNGKSIGDVIAARIGDHDRLMKECNSFDDELLRALTEKGGAEYASICALAYRQTFAAHKLAVDIDGTPMLFPKEDFSNGCISTVDVIYPSAPFFMYFNRTLLKALIEPVFRYAEMPRWTFPFAPHDLGTYPKANGQVYGGGEKNETDQMPVEESGNMIILAYAVCKAEGSADFAKKHWSVLTKWANYLKQEGLDPANQLCTDDFTGHLAHNANLSAKAIEALGCFSKICEMAMMNDRAKEFRETAKEYASEWEKKAFDQDHYRLAFDKPGTWSMKYNLVWDKLFGLNLFSKQVFGNELAFYKTRINKYGLPLDNRADFTKPEWMTWTATMYENNDDFKSFMHTIVDYLNETPDRVPFSDWYETKTARKDGFQARSVVGGIFIKMLDK